MNTVFFKKFVQKPVAVLTMVMMAFGSFTPIIAFPETALAAAPGGYVQIFSDDFDQSGSSLTNKWDNWSGAEAGDRDDSDDGFAVDVSGKGLLLEGDNDSNPDEGAQRNIATKGYASLYVEYSRAWSGNETGDSFIAEYSLDEAPFVNIETVTGATLDADTGHALKSVTIPNPDRHTKLTIRFYLNGTAADDKVGIDNVQVHGLGAPSFYDGFEDGSFSPWTPSSSPANGPQIITENAGEIWTDNNAPAVGRAVELDGSHGSEAITLATSTVGLQDVKVRYSRDIDDTESGEGLIASYSVDGTTFTQLEPVAGRLSSASWESKSYSLPAGANNNPNFKLKFDVLNNHGNDDAFIDDVVIWGDAYVAPIPACDALPTAWDFEAFSNGSVNAQGGWGGQTPPGIAINPAYDQAIVDNTYGYPTFGCKSLRVSDAVTSGSFGDWIFSPSTTNEAGELSAVNSGMSGGARQNHFEAQFDIASADATMQQTGLHVSVSPDRGDGARMSYLRFDDLADGIHVYFDDYSAGNFYETDIVTLDRTLPHTVKFEMDFVNGPSNDVVKVYVDGNLEITGTSWEDYFRDNQPAIAPPTVDSIIIQSRTGSGPVNNPANAGKGFLFDNLSLTSSTAPGSIEITKYVCPEGTSVTRSNNGVGLTVPAGCVPQQGATFGYVHGTQSDASAPYPELSASLTAAGSTDGSGILTVSGLPADGRYLVVETNESNQQLPAGDIYGLYCIGDGDQSNTNDNQELTFVPANGVVKCVAYNKLAPSKIVVHKEIDNTGGGTATANSFSFTVNGGGSVNFDSLGNATTTGVVGSYNVVENNAASYSTAYSAGCTGTIALGETKNCTITNTYIVPPPPQCDAILSSQTVVSNGGELVDGTGSSVETWEHAAWLDESADGAKWIWSDAEVVNPGVNETHVFSEDFTVTGTPLGATLYVAADNGYEISINGNPICAADTANPHYGAYETCIVTAGQLQYGLNTIVATTTNLGYPQDPTPHANPAGIIYKLVLNQNACIPAPATSDVMICKVDNTQAPLAGWTLTLKADNIEDVTVPTTLLGSSTVNALLSGVSYVATAVGTWLNQGGANPVDAEYSTTNGWATHMDGYTGYQTDILELQINNAFDPNSAWGTYNSNHTYAQSFMGTGAVANFRVFDGGGIGSTSTDPNPGWYGDNSETLAVNISKGYAGITGENGCVLFENVPVGPSYSIGEVMQDGWSNISGLGPVTIDQSEEQFTVVNTQGAPQCNPEAQTVIVSDVTTQEGGLNAVLVTFIHESWDALILGASWIWGEDPVADPTNEQTETFTKTFSVIGTPLGATLDLAADNTFKVWVNGESVCSSNADNNFSATTTCAIPASSLITGTNTLVFEVTNLELPEDWQGEINAQTNPAGLLYKLTVNNNECVTPPMPELKVHIFKYLKEGESIAHLPNDADVPSFPMISTWQTANLNGGDQGSGQYVLGNNHGGASLKYAADTAPMQAPADYTTSEVTNGSPVLPIGEQCEAGKYRLVGYKSGSSLEEAEAATLMPSPPQYMDIISDRYVIVVNEKCPGEGAQTHTKVHIYKYLRSGENVEQVQNDAAIPSFPMKVTFTAVIGGTPYVNSGPHEYVLGNGHGGAAYLYAADTSPMDTPVASY